MAEAAEFKEGELVGWKSRNDLVLGHVKAIKRVNVEVMPMNPEKKGKTVVRHPDKLMHESDIAKEDLEEAQRQGGHMSRAKMHEPPKPKTAKRKGGAAKKAAHDEHEEAEASEEEEPEAEHEPPTPKKAKAAHKKTARKVISV